MERTGNITFSVIVPVYNVQAYLSACVKSVVEQAGPADWECILVDDGSTDACPAMCDAFAQLCPGVTVIHRANGGLAAARNTGIKAAKGKWLLFLDSDDYWPPHMLEKLRAALAAAPGYRWYALPRPGGAVHPRPGCRPRLRRPRGAAVCRRPLGGLALLY